MRVMHEGSHVLISAQMRVTGTDLKAGDHISQGNMGMPDMWIGEHNIDRLRCDA